MIYHLGRCIGGFILLMNSTPWHGWSMPNAHATEPSSGCGRTRLILTAFRIIFLLVVVAHKSPHGRLSQLLELFNISPCTLRGAQACILYFRVLLCQIERCKDLRLHLWNTALSCISSESWRYSLHDRFFTGCIPLMVGLLHLSHLAYVLGYFLSRGPLQWEIRRDCLLLTIISLFGACTLL
jgi:hypothetical protein